MIHSTFPDREGIVHQRLRCTIEGCRRWRQLNYKWRPDRTKYFNQHRTCPKHRVDGSMYRSVFSDQVRENHWKHQGIDLTVIEYDKMFENQGGECLLCGRHQSQFKRRLDVDHCHETGRVRGLLCQKCNVQIGWVENYDLLAKLNEHLTC